MAELALLAGLGYAGYMSEKDTNIKDKKQSSTYSDKVLLDDFRYSQYHSDTIKQMDEKVKNIYKQREQDTMDPKKFMIPVYYGLEDKAEQMGSGTNIKQSNTNGETFESQFELSKFNPRSKPLGSNEVNSQSPWSAFEAFDQGSGSEPSSTKSDMTYGVVAPNDKSFTHNNMNIFNRMRDMNTPGLGLRDSRKLEYFTGSSTDGTYKPKKEVERFFEPVAGNTWGQGGMPSITTFIESRMEDGVRMEKRKEKPFEPRKIGPGIGLSIDQDSLGGLHDTVRILPKNIDELRRSDNPKISYQPPILPGKKGEKRSVVAPFEHRRPDKFRTNDAPVASGGQIKGQRTADNINLELGNRTFSTPVIGPAAGNYGVATPKMKGQVKAPKEKQFGPQNQGPASGQQKSLVNQNAFNPSDTQRTQTSFSNYGTIGGTRQAITPYDPNNVTSPTQQLPSYDLYGTGSSSGYNAYNPNNVANPTQQLQNYNPYGAGSSSGYNAYNPDNIANPTQQLQNYNPYGAGASSGYNSYNPENVANPTQQLSSYNPVGAGSSAGYNAFNPYNVANPTQQLQSYDPVGGAAAGFLPSAFNPYDLAKSTQQLQSFDPAAGAAAGNVPSSFNPYDLAKFTQQQDLMTKQFQTNFVGQQTHTTHFEDMAKQTQQQDIMARQFQNNLIGKLAHTTQFQDMARQTQQQDLMTNQFQNNLTGPSSYIIPLQDQVKNTQQQDLMTQQFNMFLASGYQGPTTQLQDMARQTQQQDLVTKTNMGWMGTHQDSGYIVTDAHAPTTLKQLVNYNGHINAVGNQSTAYANAADATKWYAPTTLKDQVKIVNHIGGAGITSQQINQMQYSNANTDAFRENTVTSRSPTTANVKLAPSTGSFGSVELKERVNIDRYNPPRQTNFNAGRPDLNMAQKTTPFHDDNINQYQMSTLQTNPYYSNGPSQMYHYMNTPEYSNTINRQQLVIAPLGQSVCTNLGRLQ